MKRLTALLCSIILLLTLAACQTESVDSQPSKKPSSGSSTAGSTGSTGEEGPNFSVPEVSIPQVSVPEVSVPQVSIPSAPSTPSAPSVPSTPSAPSAPTEPSAPETPPAPQYPDFDPEAAAPLVGLWHLDIPVTGEMMGRPGVNTEMVMTVSLDFYADGKVLLFISQDSMVEMVKEQVYAELSAMGMNKDAVDAFILSQYGMTMDEYVISMMGDMEDMEQWLDYYVVGNTVSVGEYADPDGWLHAGVLFSGDKITILTLELPEGETSDQYADFVKLPMVMERQEGGGNAQPPQAEPSV